MEYASQTPLDRMWQAASRIVLVGDETRPTRDLIERYRKHADLGVSTHLLTEWYCLLRKTQGDLFLFNNDLRHMIDSHQFLADSLFCEWAYIVNLDSEKLEVYRGFNKDPHASGRYSRKSVDRHSEFNGVTLIKDIPVSDIQKESIDTLIEELEKIGCSTQLTD